MKHFAMALMKTRSLRILKLSGNPLSPDDIKSFLRSIEKKNSLNVLSFGSQTWFTKECIDIVARIAKKYPDLQIIYKECFTPKPTKAVDFSKLLMDRCKYLAMAPKNKKLQKNMGHFFIKVLQDRPEFCTKIEFEQMIEQFKIKLDQPLIAQVALNWSESYGKKGANKRIALHKLANYYLELHPTENPPEPVANKTIKKKKKK